MTRNFIIVAAGRWFLREKAACRKYAAVCVCSDADRRVLGDHANVQVIPNGFSVIDFRSPKRGRRIGFIGTLEYWANREGLEWFLRNVWSIIHTRVPDLTFRIVGSGSLTSVCE